MYEAKNAAALGWNFSWYSYECIQFRTAVLCYKTKDCSVSQSQGNCLRNSFNDGDMNILIKTTCVPRKWVITATCYCVQHGWSYHHQGLSENQFCDFNAVTFKTMISSHSFVA